MVFQIFSHGTTILKSRSLKKKFKPQWDVFDFNVWFALMTTAWCIPQNYKVCIHFGPGAASSHGCYQAEQHLSPTQNYKEWSVYACFITYPSHFSQFGEHDNNSGVVLPQHPPVVLCGLSQWALGCYVGLLLPTKLDWTKNTLDGLPSLLETAESGCVTQT